MADKRAPLPDLIDLVHGGDVFIRIAVHDQKISPPARRDHATIGQVHQGGGIARRQTDRLHG